MASDFMGRLPMKKLELYRKTIPPTHVVPIDLYPYKIESNKKNDVVWCCPKVKEFPRAIDLKVNGKSGIYDVVAVFNWEDEEASKTISISEDLGLETELEYVIFDFWNQTLKDIASNEITCSIPAHGTCVYVIRPLLDRPQLLATSRHITGTVSVKEVSWDSSKSCLKGTSEIVKDDPYSLFIHVPEGMSVSKVNADTEILYHKTANGLLEVKFAANFHEGDKKIINWEIEF